VCVCGGGGVASPPPTSWIRDKSCKDASVLCSSFLHGRHQGDSWVPYKGSQIIIIWLCVCRGQHAGSDVVGYCVPAYSVRVCVLCIQVYRSLVFFCIKHQVPFPIPSLCSLYLLLFIRCSVFVFPNHIMYLIWRNGPRKSVYNVSSVFLHRSSYVLCDCTLQNICAMYLYFVSSVCLS